jgi:hypothetical protein
MGIDLEADRRAGGVTRRVDPGKSVDDGGEEKGVQRAPGVEGAPVDGEPVRCRVQGDAVPDDLALRVVLGVRQRLQPRPDLVEAAAGHFGEVFEGDRFTASQCPQQRRP